MEGHKQSGSGFGDLTDISASYRDLMHGVIKTIIDSKDHTLNDREKVLN